MTVRYVGPGGSDANDGLSWANRKLTLNGVEDTPVVAGDTVYVGPGVYRESLTVDVSGSSGNVITYVGDVTGQNTDGVGGVVRITGSNTDTTATRDSCIVLSGKSYRAFRGFHTDVTTSIQNTITGPCSDLTFEDMVVTTTASTCLSFSGIVTNVTVRRCRFCMGVSTACSGIGFWHSADASNLNALIENCIFGPCPHTGVGVSITRGGGITISHCTFLGLTTGFNVATNPAAGQMNNIRNCLFDNCTTALAAPSGGATFITENYNAISRCQTARTNVTAGANDYPYPILAANPILSAGMTMPQPAFGQLSQWSFFRRRAGTSMATGDFFGITRPTTDSKKSWGAIQYQEPIRSTAQTYSSSAASLQLEDAGRVQFVVPVTATSTTISVRAYREANYAGTAPQMVIKQAGQSDRTTTDAGSASAWNELTDTFTPAAAPPYVVVELVSSNMATSGSYNTYWDSLAVS